MVYTVKSLTEIYKTNEKISLRYFRLFDKSIKDEDTICSYSVSSKTEL